MLEFLRKYQYGLMFVVAVVVIIAFAFLYDSNSYGSQRVTKAFTVYGDDYTDADVARGRATFELSQRLGMYEFLGSLYGQRRDGSPQEFIYQHIILKKKALEMGLHASTEAIEEEIRSLRPFQFQGSFDQTAFDNFKSNLGSFGYTVQDLYDLVGDAVVLEKLKELLGANFVAASTEVDDNFLSRYQKVQSYKVVLKKEDYAKDIAVTDEEIAEFYEKNKANLMSDAQRAVEYVHFIAPKFEDPKPATPPGFPGGLTPPEMLRAPDDTKDPLAIPDLGDLDSKPGSGESAEDTLTKEIDLTPNEEDPTPAPTPEAGAEEVPATSDEAVPTPEEATEESGEPGDDGCQGSEEVIEEGAETEEVVNEVSPVEGTSALDEKLANEIDEKLIDAAEVTSPVVEETKPAVEETKPAVEETKPAEIKPVEIKPTAIPALKVATPEERKAANNTFNLAIDDFLVTAAKGGDFAELTAKATAEATGKNYKIASGKTELFAKEEPPEAFKEQPQLLDEIFSRATAQPLSNPPVRVADGFYVFKVIDFVDPKELTLEEATEEIREILIAQKTQEALEEAGKEMKEKLTAEIKKGTSFSDAAKALNLLPERIPTFEGSAIAGDNANLRQIIGDTVAGQVSEAMVEEDTATFVYIASRTISEDAEKTAEEKKKSIATQLADFSYENTIFNAWLDQARVEANPKPDNLGLGRDVL